MIVGYPKSGNTWLGYLLSNYFGVPYYDCSLEEKLLSGQDNELLDGAKDYNENFRGMERTAINKGVGSILKTHALPNHIENDYPLFLKKIGFVKEDPVVLIVREPKDVAVSFFYYSYLRIYGTQRVKLKKQLFSFLPYAFREWFVKTLYFKNFVLYIAKEWLVFNKHWLKQNPIIIKYEDLTSNPNKTIRYLLESLRLEWDAEKAAESIDYCSFDNLRKIEEVKSKNSKRTLIGRNVNFFRKGISGDWKNHFPRSLSNEFNGITANIVKQIYGEK